MLRCKHCQREMRADVQHGWREYCSARCRVAANRAKKKGAKSLPLPLKRVVVTRPSTEELDLIQRALEEVLCETEPRETVEYIKEPAHCENHEKYAGWCPKCRAADRQASLR